MTAAHREEGLRQRDGNPVLSGVNVKRPIAKELPQPERGDGDGQVAGEGRDPE